MFESLTARLAGIFDQLRRRGKLSEADVDAALREVRLALLEADVNFGVVKTLLGRIRERALGEAVSRALNPGQQVIKIVNEELVQTLGEPAPLRLQGPKPRVILLLGLQGSGKTTTAGKLAGWLRAKGERVLLVAADTHRPAAIDQLRQLGARIDVPVEGDPAGSPADVVAKAVEKGDRGGFGAVIVDTAGRSQLDADLMAELKVLSEVARPVETILVLDSMIGQEALNVALAFHQAVGVSGLIFSKMDGDARGGAAISVRSVTGIPIKFIGTGEKLDALEVYDPARLASRILGMGDVAGLIERAEAAFETADLERSARKIAQGGFTLEDWLDQMKQVRKMGPLAQLMDMLPGSMGEIARRADPSQVEHDFKRTEAIIQSMTLAERRDPDLLNASRRRRIAAGAGLQVQDVNRLIKQFRETQKWMKAFQKSGGRGLPSFLGR